MKNLFDKIGAIFIGIFIMTFLEGILTLGMAFDLEKYNTGIWIMQGMVLYVTCWASVRIQESNIK